MRKPCLDEFERFLMLKNDTLKGNQLNIWFQGRKFCREFKNSIMEEWHYRLIFTILIAGFLIGGFICSNA